MSTPIYVISIVLGLWLGWALNGLQGAIILGLITAVAGFLLSRYMANYMHPDKISNPPLAENLFTNPRWALLWLPVRLFLGWEWFEAGLHKVQDAKWAFGNGEAILGYWQRAVAIPQPPARPSITYEWYRAFLQGMIDAKAHTWFGGLIAWGELLVGVGLIVGGLVGIAAFFGILMNWSFLMAGSTSSNPLLLIMGVAVMLAWKTAGYYGADRVLLRLLGTPWERFKTPTTQVAGGATPGSMVTSS